MPQILQPDGRLTPMNSCLSIPYGAALVVRDVVGLESWFDLVDIATEFPWLPICVPLLNGHAERAVVSAWRRHPPLRSLVQLGTDDPAQFATSLRKVLTSEVAPEPRALADYVALSCANRRLHIAIIAECLGHARPSRSARHSTFRRHYRLTGKHWQGLYLLTQAVSLPGRPNASDAAARLGIDTRTLRAWCDTLLSSDWKVVRDGFGWRWLVDQALRHRAIPDEVRVRESTVA